MSPAPGGEPPVLPEYQVVSTTVLFDHPKVRIVQDMLDFAGRRQRYVYLASPVEAAATVGLTPDGCIPLTYQYRHPIGRAIYDLPAGSLNPGEDPLEGARREFEEETGYYPRRMERLGYFNQFPGSLRAATNLFFATDLAPSRQNLDQGEVLAVIFKPAAEVLKMILNGEIIDGSLQLGVLLAIQKGFIKM